MIRKMIMIKNHGYESRSMLWEQFRNKLQCIISSATRDCSTYKFQYASLLKFESHNKCRRVIKGRRGFTILEIMVAVVLIVIVVVSVIQLSSASLRNLASSNDQIDALIYANSKMREILDLDKIEDKSWNETDDNGYSYEITIAESLKERTDSLAVKMEEITLVTSWVAGNKKKQIIFKTAKIVSKADSLKSTGN